MSPLAGSPSWGGGGASPSTTGFSLSLLGYAPQHILDCVGERREPHDDKQVGESAAKKSMVAVGLLHSRGRIGAPKWDRTSVEGRKTVVGVLGVAVRHHIRQGEGLSAGAELLLSLLLLLHLLFQGDDRDGET